MCIRDRPEPGGALGPDQLVDRALLGLDGGGQVVDLVLHRGQDGADVDHGRAVGRGGGVPDPVTVVAGAGHRVRPAAPPSTAACLASSALPAVIAFGWSRPASAGGVRAAGTRWAAAGWAVAVSPR